jgi:hypothetical protein
MLNRDFEHPLNRTILSEKSATIRDHPRGDFPDFPDSSGKREKSEKLTAVMAAVDVLQQCRPVSARKIAGSIRSFTGRPTQAGGHHEVRR